MAHLSVSLLGSLVVTQDGQPVSSFEYNKVKGLFSYLIAEADRPHRREALAGLLWPDQSQKAALDSLRNALSKLRLAIRDRTAEPPFLFITSDAIQFNRSSDHDLDLERFTNLLSAVKTHTHRRLESCKSCSERLKKATELYQGIFLQGFSTPDSDLFEDWLLSRREKYLNQAIGAFQKLASIHETHGEGEQALAYAQQLLELDPFDELTHRQVMRLLASLDLRAQACVHYEKFHKLLEIELGVEPAEETTRLYDQIRNVAFSSAFTKPKKHNNLPPALTSFIGRERELAEINALIDDPSCRLLTLVGPGGVGKTRLAISAASQQLETFQQGACYVSLAAISSIEFILPNILEALGLTPFPRGDHKAQLLSYLQDKELVLILDNFEHLQEGAAIIAEMLEKAPQLMLLVTSRQRLCLQSEWCYEVNGLSYPTSENIQNLAAYDAVRLFTARLHQVMPRVSQFEHDLLQVARVCQLVEGLPLGIELAASAVRLRSLSQVARAIEMGNEDLAISSKDIPARHRSLRSVFEHSWNLLDEQERTVFPGLAVFKGGFTSEAALEVVGASQPVLSALVEHSMLRYDPHKERFDLHELVRQFALDKLRSQGMENSICEHHLKYFMQWAERIDPQLHGPDQIAWLRCLDADLENLRSALKWGLEFDPATGMRLVSALYLFWWRRNLNIEGGEWMVKFLDTPECKAPTRYRAHALTVVISLAMHMQQLLEAWGNECLAICEALHDESGKAFGLFMLGTAYYRGIGKYDLCHLYLAQSIEIYRGLGDRWGMAGAYFELANFVIAINGDALNQRNYLEQSLELYRQVGDLNGIASALDNMANAIIDIELDLDKGQRMVEEALKIYGQLNARFPAHNALNNYAIILTWQGNYRRAWEVMNERVQIIYEGRNPGRILQADQLMARLNRWIGKEQEAFTALEQIRKTLVKIVPFPVHDYSLVIPLVELSYILLKRGETKLARSYIKTGMELCQLPAELSLFFHSYGTIDLCEGNSTAALSDFQESLKICKECYFGLNAIRDIEGIAGSLYLSGRFAQAVKLLGSMSALRDRMGSKVFPCDQADYALLKDNLKNALGMADFDHYWELGQIVSFEQAMDEALAIQLAP